MKYCLIGEKLGHSYSAELHGAMGMDYSLVEVPRDKLVEFLHSNDYDGFNVTIPYKKDVIPYLDELDESVTLSGAANTVKRVKNKLVGYNTDIGGMRYMIESKGVTLQSKNLLILGGGGTCNTAKTLATMQGAKSVNFVDVDGEINYANCYDLVDTEIIINATPVGMYPNVYAKLVDLSRFSRLEAVFDCIYNPFTTELLAQAKELGLVYNDGLPMLVRQAVLAENIWKGVDDNPLLTEKLVSYMRAQKANLVLFGMPSSGKTTLGKILAQRLGRPFVDLDEYVANKHGKTPAEIIQSSGEKTFRQLESQAVAEIAPKSGMVISLGGGTVLDPANVTKLKKNGVMIYLNRDLELLSTDNRPLSQRQGVRALYEQRKDIYDAAKNAKVDNNGDLKTATKEIIRAYETACNKWC